MNKKTVKYFALLLAIVMTALMLPVGQVAFADYDYSGFNKKIEELKAKYPDGTPWSNSNSYPAGKAWGCVAFANLLADEIFGCSTPRASWNEIAVNSVMPGDVVTEDIFNSDGSVAKYKHTAFVIDVRGNDIIIAEGNITWPGYSSPIIHWGRTKSKSDFTKAYHAPNYHDVIKQIHIDHSFEFQYYQEEHPHYAFYKCGCGETKVNKDETTFNSSCVECLNTVRPGKVTIKEVKETYYDNEDIVFEWDDSNSKATHISLYIDKLIDGEYKWCTGEQYAENGTYTCQLEAGEYQVRLIAYNSNYKEADKSDWLHAEYDIVDFVVLEGCEHEFGEWEKLNDEQDQRVCSLCGKTETADHDYQPSLVAATCERDAYMEYTCSQCGDNYTEELSDQDKYDYTDWGTERPEEPEKGEIEEKTEYKYRKKTVKTGDSVPAGWTKDVENWVESGSGSVDFVSSWPSGFDKNNELYKKYNNSVSASETATAKRTLGSESTVGYIYWHWSYPLDGSHSEGNRYISDAYNNYISGCGYTTIFEAFVNDSPLELQSVGVFKATGHSTYSYWWYGTGSELTEQLPVKRVSYTDYKKEYTYSQWSDWSDWQTKAVEVSENCEVETRTLYCIKTEKEGLYASGAHQWDEGVVTLEATCGNDGEKTFTCALCSETKTEAIPATGEHKFGEWTVTKAASVEEEGEETRTCSVCGKTETRAIPKLDPTPEVVYGDADGSGTVDLNDCLLIMDFFVGKDVELDEKAADANGDGTVDLNDCLLVMDFFVGKDVVLGPPTDWEL